MPLFRLGMHFASVTYPGLADGDLYPRIAEVAVAAEQSGFDSIWLPDHALQNRIGGGTSAPMFEAYTLLGALAVSTRRARLGTLVSPVTFRNPALLAKTVATLDVISGGRAVLGLGAAWDEGEHEAYGLDFPAVAERQDRLEEAAQICRAMLTEETATFPGRFYSVREAHNSPRPLRPVPIMIGGGGELRTLRAVARYGDACNIFGDAETIRHKLAVLARHCEEAGRDLSAITTTAAVVPSEDDPKALAAAARERLGAGVDGVIVLAAGAPDAATVRSWGEALASSLP